MRIDTKMCLLLGIMLLGGTMIKAQVLEVETTRLAAERRMTEIKKLVDLSSAQESEFKQLCMTYQLQLDSALYFEDDPISYVNKINKAEKEFTQTFYTILTDKQTTQYAYNKGYADVKRKTADKLNLLRETGAYNEAELKKIEEQIFNYLMLEKVVYMRDKHDVSKQKENIHRLKAIQPPYLKAAESHRKLKHNGRTNKGKVKWEKYIRKDWV